MHALVLLVSLFVCIFSQALTSKYFQVGQNLNTSSQPTSIPRASQPVAGGMLSRSRPSVTNINHKFSSTSIGSGSSKYTDARPSESKEVLVPRKGSKESWSLESVSPAPNMAPVVNAKKRSGHRQSVQEDRMPWEGKTRQLGSIRESPVETHVRPRDGVQSRRAQDLADLDSILSEFDNASLKKDTRYVSMWWTHIGTWKCPYGNKSLVFVIEVPNPVNTQQCMLPSRINQG